MAQKAKTYEDDDYDYEPFPAKSQHDVNSDALQAMRESAQRFAGDEQGLDLGQKIVFVVAIVFSQFMNITTVAASIDQMLNTGFERSWVLAFLMSVGLCYIGIDASAMTAAYLFGYSLAVHKHGKLLRVISLPLLLVSVISAGWSIDQLYKYKVMQQDPNKSRYNAENITKFNAGKVNAELAVANQQAVIQSYNSRIVALNRENDNIQARFRDNPQGIPAESDRISAEITRINNQLSIEGEKLRSLKVEMKQASDPQTFINSTGSMESVQLQVVQDVHGLFDITPAKLMILLGLTNLVSSLIPGFFKGKVDGRKTAVEGIHEDIARTLLNWFS